MDNNLIKSLIEAKLAESGWTVEADGVCRPSK